MSTARTATSESSSPVAERDLARLRDEVTRLSDDKDDKYQRPGIGEVDRNCDLTMKGGTTSGVVYPLAVCELALRYRFRNIGGASAGAIAAVAAAAAEHGQELDKATLDAARQRSRQLQDQQPHRGHVLPGFAGLAQIPLWLIENNHLLKLFQPSQRTRPLFNVVLAVTGRKPLAAVWRAVLATGRPARWLFVLIAVAALLMFSLVAVLIVGASGRVLLAEQTLTLISAMQLTVPPGSTWRLGLGALVAVFVVGAAVALFVWGRRAVLRPLADHAADQEKIREVRRRRQQGCPQAPTMTNDSMADRLLNRLRWWVPALVVTGFALIVIGAAAAEVLRVDGADGWQRTLDIATRAALLATAALWLLVLLAVVVLLLLVVLAGLLGTSAWRFITLYAEELNFGLCPGATAPRERPFDPDVPPLAEWLTQVFDELAGRPAPEPKDDLPCPLTFGDLWGEEARQQYHMALEPTGDDPRGSERVHRWSRPLELAAAKAKRLVNLFGDLRGGTACKTYREALGSKEDVPNGSEAVYRRSRPVELAAAKAKRLVNLELMTTNLSEGRPYRLPFPERFEDLSYADPNTTSDSTSQPPKSPEPAFYFAVADMERLFPRRIVDWLQSKSREVVWVEPEEPYAVRQWQKLPQAPPWPQPRPKLTAPATVPDESVVFYRLPPSEDLPVVVAARMSLPFPGLISAVRLHGVQYGARVRDSEGNVVTRDGEPCRFPPNHRVVPHWFSDGGITANFPVHFFDALLPRWPTFGLNLTGYPEGFENEHVWLPDQGHGGHNMVWERITSMQGFLGRILGTFHGWRDNLQTTMPGYRGRIAHVRRLSTEGGVNLTMPPAVIAGMALRGCLAGRRLRVRFTEGADWRYPRETDRHRWLRFRIALSEVQQLLAHVDAERDIYQPWCNKERFEAFNRAYTAPQEGATKEEVPRWPFPHPKEGFQKARTSLDRLCAAFQHVKGGDFDFADGAPWPDPQLRQLPPE